MEVLKQFAATPNIVQKSFWVSSHFVTENYTWNIVQNSSCQIIGKFCPKIKIRKYLKQFSRGNY